MNCPHCKSAKVLLCNTKTDLGYSQYRYRSCSKQFNERTHTLYNFIQYCTEVFMLAVHYYYRFRTSLDDVGELMKMGGIHLSHQTVHNCAQTFSVKLWLKLRQKRFGLTGKKWHIDATYVRVEGRWCYLYRAIDKAGNLVDVYLSDVRDSEAAEKFFYQAKKTTGCVPKEITTDKELALYSAIKNSFPVKTKHRDSKFMNNILESDHRLTKSRLSTLKRFKIYFVH
jgi:putative transposase